MSRLCSRSCSCGSKRFNKYSWIRVSFVTITFDGWISGGFVNGWACNISVRCDTRHTQLISTVQYNSFQALMHNDNNRLKSQTVSFGGENPCQCQIMLNDHPIPWVNKVKHFGVYFYSNSGTTGISDTCRKFHGRLNSILSVLGSCSCSNEMAAVHMIRTHCLHTLMYGCELWSLTDSSVHTISVTWNNCFRQIFNFWWRESVKVLQYYCNVLPIPYLIDHRRLIFGARFATQKMWCCKHCHLWNIICLLQLVHNMTFVHMML